MILTYFIEFLIRHHDFCQKIIEGILEEYKAYKNQKIAIIGSSFCFQFTRTALKSTSPVTRSVECIKSILMVWANLKCSVIRKQPVEVGQCFRRGEMALLISSALGMITNAVLVI